MQIKKNMIEHLDGEILENTKAIDGLKKIKHMFMGIIIILIIIIITVATLGVINYYQNREKSAIGKYTYLLAIQSEEIRENQIETIYLFTFDKNETCIDARVFVKMKDLQELDHMYQQLIQEVNKSVLCNIEKNGDYIKASSSYYNQKNKKELIDIFNNYKIIDM